MTDKQYAINALLADIEATPIAFYRPRPTVKKFHADDEHRTRFLFGGKQSSKSYGVTAEVSMAIVTGART